MGFIIGTTTQEICISLLKVWGYIFSVFFFCFWKLGGGGEQKSLGVKDFRGKRPRDQKSRGKKASGPILGRGGGHLLP